IIKNNIYIYIYIYISTTAANTSANIDTFNSSSIMWSKKIHFNQSSEINIYVGEVDEVYQDKHIDVASRQQ
ncbi:hypothetical protein LSH36_1692g00009, partial [Paralvinella palmiformis]